MRADSDVEEDELAFDGLDASTDYGGSSMRSLTGNMENLSMTKSDTTSLTRGVDHYDEDDDYVDAERILPFSRSQRSATVDTAPSQSIGAARSTATSIAGSVSGVSTSTFRTSTVLQHSNRPPRSSVSQDPSSTAYTSSHDGRAFPKIPRGPRIMERPRDSDEEIEVSEEEDSDDEFDM